MQDGAHVVLPVLQLSGFRYMPVGVGVNRKEGYKPFSARYGAWAVKLYAVPSGFQRKAYGGTHPAELLMSIRDFRFGAIPGVVVVTVFPGFFPAGWEYFLLIDENAAVRFPMSLITDAGGAAVYAYGCVETDPCGDDGVVGNV